MIELLSGLNALNTEEKANPVEQQPFHLAACERLQTTTVIGQRITTMPRHCERLKGVWQSRKNNASERKGWTAAARSAPRSDEVLNSGPCGALCIISISNAVTCGMK